MMHNFRIGLRRPSPAALPSGWDTAKIGDLCAVTGGGKLGLTKGADYQTSGYPAYSAAGQDGFVKVAEFDTEGVVLSSIGARCGRCFYATGKWTTLANTQAIVPKNERLLAKYLYYRVNRRSYWPISGSAQPFIKPSSIRKCWIELPPFEIQQRIVSILDTVDAAIQQTDAVIAKQQQVKKGMLQDLLTRGLDEEGRLRDPERYPEQFKDSPLGRIPEDWEAPGIGNITSLVSSGSTPKGGKKVYQEEGILFIRSQNVWPRGLNITDVAFISEEIHDGMKRTQLVPHDVLLNITGASIGRCCVVSSSVVPANVNQHVCIIRLENESPIDSSYLSTVVSSSIGQAQIGRVQAGGSREGLNYSQVKALVVPWPPQEERRRIVSRIKSMSAKVEFEVKYREKMLKLKRGLMQDLLTGRVRVPEAEEIVSEVVA